MFFGNVSLVLERHAPDVTSGLLGSNLRAAKEHTQAEPYQSAVGIKQEGAAPVGWAFPPYDFEFTVEADECGCVTVQDNLAPDTSLICTPYNFEGVFHPYDAEVFAGTWAYLISTPRRVLARPSFDALFAAPKNFVEHVSRAFEATLAPPDSHLTFDLEFVACAGRVWSCLTPHSLVTPIAESIEQTLANMLEIPVDVFAHFGIALRPDGGLLLRFSPFVPQHTFLNQRINIVQSLIALDVDNGKRR